MARGVVTLLLLWAALSPAANAAGFGCYGKLSRQEQMICDDKLLSGLDYRLNAVYALARQLTPSDGRLRATQRAWLDVRAKCGDAACLKAAYEMRLDHLMQNLQRAASPLPARVGGRVEHPPTDSNYCQLSQAITGDYFSIDLSVDGQAVSGRIDGIFDCGRKVWGWIDIAGTLRGKIAVVHFQPGFSSEEGPQAEALIVARRGKLYWQVISEISGESYVPRAERVPAGKPEATMEE